MIPLLPHSEHHRRFEQSHPCVTSNIPVGATLLEVTVGLLIFSILLTFSIPSYYQALERNRFKRTVHTLFDDLNYAKQLANHHKRSISICPTINQTHCSDNPQHWADGWLLFFDDDATWSPSDASIIRVTELIKSPKNLTINPNRNIAQGLSIAPLRRMGKTQGTGLPNGRFTLCANAQTKVTIYINVFGIPRLEASDQSCHP